MKKKEIIIRNISSHSIFNICIHFYFETKIATSWKLGKNGCYYVIMCSQPSVLSNCITCCLFPLCISFLFIFFFLAYLRLTSLLSPFQNMKARFRSQKPIWKENLIIYLHNNYPTSLKYEIIIYFFLAFFYLAVCISSTLSCLRFSVYSCLLSIFTTEHWRPASARPVQSVLPLFFIISRGGFFSLFEYIQRNINIYVHFQRLNFTHRTSNINLLFFFFVYFSSLRFSFPFLSTKCFERKRLAVG